MKKSDKFLGLSFYRAACVLLLFLSYNVKAQEGFIIAGKYSTSDYHYKFTPDSVVINVHGAGSYSIDINNDGIMDIKLNISGGGSMASANNYCSITALNNNNVAFGLIDTCFTINGSYLFKKDIARAFNYDDTISSNQIWTNEATLKYMANVMDSHYCSGSYGLNYPYVGVRIMIDSVYRYGWIKIASMNLATSAYENSSLIMGEYACENSPNKINSKYYNEIITIYPNPCTTKINIEQTICSGIEMSLFDIAGTQIIKELKSNSKNTEIDMSRMETGVYFLKVKTGEGFFCKKIIKQ